MDRRRFLNNTGAAVVSMAGAASLAQSQTAQAARPSSPKRRPNVILIMTDDQGYSDLGCHGNPQIKTPNIDAFAKQSTEFSQFYVCPVCAPTRACLMTGRYNYRTGVVDTWLGRAMMHGDETTIAEILAKAGYRTGIFGKWHLGDNYPMRPMDQGFHESLVHRGGGIGQPADPQGGEGRYFDPILVHNGKLEERKGYCTDVYTDAAIEFIETNREKPFFVYIPTNAPHSPLIVDERYVEPYKKMGLDDKTAKIFGMIANIDENVGKLLAKLKALDLEDDTIVIFMTDNGPAGKRPYNAGLRASKGSVYDGGIRVPFFIRWPGRFAVKKVNTIGAHIDVLPTILAMCGVDKPKRLKIDGRNLLPLMRDANVKWPDRTLYFQWHRGDEPEPFRASAARSQRYKLVNGKELYDMAADPGEKNDVAAKNPKVVAKMRRDYQRWFKDVSGTRGYAPPRIHIGTPHENPVTFTPQDWRGPNASWRPDGLGYWEVKVAREGRYDVTLTFSETSRAGRARFKLGDANLTQSLEKGATKCKFGSVDLEAANGRLQAWIETGKDRVGVKYVDVKRLP